MTGGTAWSGAPRSSCAPCACRPTPTSTAAASTPCSTTACSPSPSPRTTARRPTAGSSPSPTNHQPCACTIDSINTAIRSTPTKYHHLITSLNRTVRCRRYARWRTMCSMEFWKISVNYTVDALSLGVCIDRCTQPSHALIGYTIEI